MKVMMVVNILAVIGLSVLCLEVLGVFKETLAFGIPVWKVTFVSLTCSQVSVTITELIRTYQVWKQK